MKNNTFSTIDCCATRPGLTRPGSTVIWWVLPQKSEESTGFKFPHNTKTSYRILSNFRKEKSQKIPDLSHFLGQRFFLHFHVWPKINLLFQKTDCFEWNGVARAIRITKSAVCEKKSLWPKWIFSVNLMDFSLIVQDQYHGHQ